MSEPRPSGRDAPPTPAVGTRVSRRTVLRGLSLAALATGFGALGIRAADQGVFSPGRGAAFDAWRLPSDMTSPEAMVAAAVLAASPHNIQNWWFAVDAAEGHPTRIALHDDATRSLGAVDPTRREAHLGLGCAAANLELAAAAGGRPATTTWWPTGPSGAACVAELGTGPAAADDPLWLAIPRRHSDRGAYPAPRPQSADLRAVAELAGVDDVVRVRWITGAERDAVGELLVDTAQAICDDEEMSRANAAWFRYDWDAVQQHKDGLVLDAQALPGPLLVAAKVLPATSRTRADASWVASTRDVHTATAGAYLTLETARTDRASVLRAGRLLQRFHLALVAQGWSTQHMNQALEIRDRHESTGRHAELARRTTDMLGPDAVAVARLGRPSGAAAPSPRRPAEEVLG